LFATIDAKLQKNSVTGSTTVDGRLQKAFTLNSSVLDSKLQKVIGLYSSIDAVLTGLQSNILHVGFNGLLQSTELLTTGFNSLLQSAESITTEFNSYLIRQYQLYNSIDAKLMKLETKTVLLSAYIQSTIQLIDDYLDIQIRSIDNNINIKPMDGIINIYK
jgi:hypothetical protein